MAVNQRKGCVIFVVLFAASSLSLKCSLRWLGMSSRVLRVRHLLTPFFLCVLLKLTPVLGLRAKVCSLIAINGDLLTAPPSKKGEIGNVITADTDVNGCFYTGWCSAFIVHPVYVSQRIKSLVPCGYDM